MAKNYYKTLGVSSNASKSQIKRAYRKLAMKYHPDKNNSPEAQIIFIEINEAYSFLTDENNQKLKKPIVKNTSTRKSKTSQEELNKRMEWARRYVEYKKIKEEKINEITFYKIQKSSLRWIIPTINSLSVFFAFLILLDFKILPTSSINVNLITRYVDMDSKKLVLKFQDDDSNKFQFGISFEDIKQINIASIKNYTCQKSKLFRQKTHMVLNFDNNDVIIFNHYCVYKIFYFYFILLLLPLITIFSKGPNTVYILSSYVISSVSVLGMVFLLLTLVI